MMRPSPTRPVRNRRGVRALVCIVGCLVALSGCSVPRDDSAHPIHASLLPQLGPTNSKCQDLSDVNTIAVPVFMITGQEDTRILTPLERDVDPPVTPQGALQRLLSCPPNTQEQQNGYTTQLPVTDLEAFVAVPGDDPGNYEIRLSPLRSRDNEEVTELNKLAVAQIVYTVTNPDFFPDVKGVRFTIGGEPQAASTDGATKAPNEFVTREDFTVTRPTTTTTTTTTTMPPEDTADPADPNDPAAPTNPSTPDDTPVSPGS